MSVEEIIGGLREQYPGFSDFSLGKIYLFDRMKRGEASSLELALLSLFLGNITIAQFLSYVEVEMGFAGS